MNRQGIHEALDLLVTSAECEAARERDRAIAERDKAIAERDEARKERDAALKLAEGATRDYDALWKPLVEIVSPLPYEPADEALQRVIGQRDALVGKAALQAAEAVKERDKATAERDATQKRLEKSRLEYDALWRAVVEAIPLLPGETVTKALQRAVRERDQLKALAEDLRVECETAIRERGQMRQERDKVIAERDEARDERDVFIARFDEVRAERDKAIAERDALRERLEDLDETIAMVEMPNIPWTASGNKDRQGKPVRTVVDPNPVIGGPESRPENWNKSTDEDIERVLLSHPKVLAEMRRAMESLRKVPAAVESDDKPSDEPDSDRVAVALASGHKFAMNRVKEKVQALIESMRGWSYCGDALVDDPDIYVPLDALTDTLGMPRTPPVKERAQVEPVKISKAGPIRGSEERPGWVTYEPENAPGDDLHVEYVNVVQFAYGAYGPQGPTTFWLWTNETDGGAKYLECRSYHAALLEAAKQLLDLADWAHYAESKNAEKRARVRREAEVKAAWDEREAEDRETEAKAAEDLGARTGEKRYADGFNAGYDQGLADARKEMRDAQEGDDR